jgi:hypothetical protein
LYTCVVRIIFTAVASTFLIVFCLTFSEMGRAQRQCDGMEEQWRRQSQPKDWNGLYRLFKRFGRCDDGEIASGTSHYVAQLFLNQWMRLDVLDHLIVSDRPFGEFVLHHVDATVSENELRIILDHSKSHCPSGEADLCHLVAIRADLALNDLRK